MKVFDWVLLVYLATVIPVFSVVWHRNVRARVDVYGSRARLAGYRWILALEWLLLAITVFGWAVLARSWDGLGLGLSASAGLWVGIGLAVMATVLLFAQWMFLRGNTEKLRGLTGQFHSLRAILPHTPREVRWFIGLSVTAGIVEEIIYRGFLLGVLSAALGTGAGILISSAIFGLGHMYQGPVGILKTGAIGLAMAGLTVLSGSVLPAILVHIVLDITSGLIAHRVVNVSAEPEGALPQAV